MKLKKTPQIVLIICFVILVIFSTTANANALEPLKIGFIGTFTGLEGAMGEEAWRGAQIAIDEQNAKGGIQGRKIEPIVRNTPDMDTAIAAVEKLINDDKVNIIVDVYGESTSYSIVPICQRSKVISWHMNTCTPAITQMGDKYLFRTSVIGDTEGADMIDFVNNFLLPKLNTTPEKIKIAGVFEDNIYGNTILDGALERAKELGINFALIEKFTPGAQDISSLMLKVEKLNPNVFINVCEVPDAQLMLREAMKLNLDVDLVLGTGTAIGTGWLVDTYGADMVNTLCSTNWPVQNTSPEYAPGMANFVEKYKKRFKRERLFTCHSVVAYTGLVFLWDALERTKNLNDVESIRRAILATDIPEYTTACGWGAKFAPPGHPNMGTNLRVGNVVVQWQDGEMWTIWPKAFPGRELILPTTSPFFTRNK